MRFLDRLFHSSGRGEAEDPALGEALERHAYRLDAMGVVQPEGHGTVLEFADLIERYQTPRTVIMARCPGVCPSTLADRIEEAGHWL